MKRKWVRKRETFAEQIGSTKEAAFAQPVVVALETPFNLSFRGGWNHQVIRGQSRRSPYVKGVV